MERESIVDLQRKIRFMSNDIRQYTEEVQTQIKKQQGQISKLKKDNGALREELLSHQQSAESRPQSRPSTVIETIETYQEQIDEEQRQLKELEANIKIIQTKMFDQRKKMGGINASKDTSNALNKQLRILENRLDKANQKFNEAIAHNKDLRSEIDNLRRERVIFDKIYQKLEEELQNKRKQMAEIIEKANNDYEHRDHAQDQLGALKQQAEREQQEFEKEWKELNGLIEKAKKMQEFMKLEEQERDNARHTLEQQRHDEEAKKRKAHTTDDTGERVRTYEEAFNKIQVATGINNIDQLVETFIKAEDKNFTLFKFVNELSNEIETLEKTIGELELEISNYKVNDEAAYLQKLKIEMEERLQKYMNKSEMYEHKHQEALKVVNVLKNDIQDTFTSIDCGSYLTQEFLDESITDSNMEQFLTLIEQRTSEIFQAYALLQVKEDKRDFYVPGPQGPPANSQTRIEAPNVKDELSDEDEEEREDDKPLTMEEFKLWAEKQAEKMKDQQKSKFKSIKQRTKK